MKGKPPASAVSDALHYLSYQDRTRQEMISHLHKKGHSQKQIDEALQKLHGYGYVDDEKYARRVSASVQSHPGKGIKTIPVKLASKGVAPEVIQQVVQEYDEESDWEKAYQTAKNNLMNQADQPWHRSVEKTWAKLIRRGFSQETIQRVMQHLQNDTDLLEAREVHESQRLANALKDGERVVKKLKEKKLSHNLLTQRLFHQLYQKGYEGPLVQRAVDILLES